MAPAGSVPVIYGAELHKSRQRAAPRQLHPPGPAGTPGCPSYLLSDAEPWGQRPREGMEKPFTFSTLVCSSSPIPGLSQEQRGGSVPAGGLGQVEGGFLHWYPPSCSAHPSGGILTQQPDPAFRDLKNCRVSPGSCSRCPAPRDGGGRAAGPQEEPAAATGSAQGKGHFRLNVLSRLEPALVKSLALLGGLSWSVSRLCPLPTINQSCSKLAQMLGDSVQIQLWFGSRSHAWLHVGPGLLDRIQPPGLCRALFPSAASPQSPHTCLRLRRVGQRGRIRQRQEPAAPAGSSHFIFPAVPGYSSPETAAPGRAGRCVSPPPGLG